MIGLPTFRLSSQASSSLFFLIRSANFARVRPRFPAAQFAQPLRSSNAFWAAATARSTSSRPPSGAVAIDLPGRGVDDVERLAVGRVDGLAADDHPGGGRGCRSRPPSGARWSVVIGGRSSSWGGCGGRPRFVRQMVRRAPSRTRDRRRLRCREAAQSLARRPRFDRRARPRRDRMLWPGWLAATAGRRDGAICADPGGDAGRIDRCGDRSVDVRDRAGARPGRRSSEGRRRPGRHGGLRAGPVPAVPDGAHGRRGRGDGLVRLVARPVGRHRGQRAPDGRRRRSADRGQHRHRSAAARDRGHRRQWRCLDLRERRRPAARPGRPGRSRRRRRVRA